MNAEQFQETFSPWFDVVTKRFQDTFSEDYDINILAFLHENIDREIKLVFSSSDRYWATVRTQALYSVLTYLYEHILWKLRKEDFPNATLSCVKLLSQLIKTGLLLTQGLVDCEYIDRLLTAIKLFTGKPALLYDALLLVNGLKRAHHEPYSVILSCVLKTDYKKIKDPLLYMEIILLFRRLRALSDSNDRTLYSLATKMKPPSNLISWLVSLNVNGSVSFLKLLKHKKIVHQLMKKNIPELLLKTIRHMILRSYYFGESCSAYGEMTVLWKPSDLFITDTSSVLMQEVQPTNSSNKNLKKVNSQKHERRGKKQQKDFVSNKKPALSDKRTKKRASFESDSHVFYINNYSNLVIENEQLSPESLQESDATETYISSNSVVRTSKAIPASVDKCKKSSKKRQKSKHIHNSPIHNQELERNCEVEILNVSDSDSFGSMTGVPAKKAKKGYLNEQTFCLSVPSKRSYNVNEGLGHSTGSDSTNVKQRKKIKYSTEDKKIHDCSLENCDISSGSNFENMCITSKKEIEKSSKNSSGNLLEEDEVTIVAEVTRNKREESKEGKSSTNIQKSLNYLGTLSKETSTKKLENVMENMDRSVIVTNEMRPCDLRASLLENKTPLVQLSPQKISNNTENSSEFSDQNFPQLVKETENEETSYKLLKDVPDKPSNHNINYSFDVCINITPEREKSTQTSLIQLNQVSFQSSVPSNHTHSCNTQKDGETPVAKEGNSNSLWSVESVSKMKLNSPVSDRHIDGYAKESNENDTSYLKINAESLALETSEYNTGLDDGGVDINSPLQLKTLLENELSTYHSKCSLSQLDAKVTIQSDVLHDEFDCVNNSNENGKIVEHAVQNEVIGEINAPFSSSKSCSINAVNDVVPSVEVCKSKHDSSKDNSVSNNFSKQSVESDIRTENVNVLVNEPSTLSSSIPGPLFLDASGVKCEKEDFLNIASCKETAGNIYQGQMKSEYDGNKNNSLANNSVKQFSVEKCETEAIDFRISNVETNSSLCLIKGKSAEKRNKYVEDSLMHLDVIQKGEKENSQEFSLGKNTSIDTLPSNTKWENTKESSLVDSPISPQNNEIMENVSPELITDKVSQNDLRSENIFKDNSRTGSVSQHDINTFDLPQNDAKSEHMLKEMAVVENSFQNDPKITSLSQDNEKSQKIFQDATEAESTSQNNACRVSQGNTKFESILQMNTVKESSSQNVPKEEYLSHEDDRKSENTIQGDANSDNDLQKDPVLENSSLADPKKESLLQDDEKSKNICQGHAETESKYQSDACSLSQDDAKFESILQVNTVKESSSQNVPKTDLSHDDRKFENTLQGGVESNSTTQNVALNLSSMDANSDNGQQKDPVAESSSLNDPETDSLLQDDERSKNIVQGHVEAESTSQNGAHSLSLDDTKSEIRPQEEVVGDISSQTNPKTNSLLQENEKSENILQCNAEVKISSHNDTKVYSLSQNNYDTESTSQIDTKVDSLSQDDSKSGNILQDNTKTSRSDVKTDSVSQDPQAVKEAVNVHLSNTETCLSPFSKEKLDTSNLNYKTVKKRILRESSYSVLTNSSNPNINISCDVSVNIDYPSQTKSKIPMLTSETDSEEIDVVNISNESESDARVTKTECASDSVNEIEKLPSVAENKYSSDSLKEMKMDEQSLEKTPLKSIPKALLSDYIPQFCKNKDYVSFSDISLQNKDKIIIVDSGLKTPNPISNFSLAATAEIFCEYRNDILHGDKTDTLSRDDVSSNTHELSDFTKSPSLSSDGSDEELDSQQYSSAEEDILINETKKVSEEYSNKIVVESSEPLKNNYSVSKNEADYKECTQSGNESMKESFTEKEQPIEEKVLLRQSLRLRNKAEAKNQICSDENPEVGDSCEKESKSVTEVTDDISCNISSPKNDFVTCETFISSPVSLDKGDSYISLTSKEKQSSQKSPSKKTLSVSKSKSKIRTKKYISPPKGYSLRYRKSRQLIDDSSNLGIDLTKLQLDSPSSSKNTRSKSASQDNKFAKLLTSDIDSQKNSNSSDLTLFTKRETRSSTAKIEQEATQNTPGYNLRTRTSIIAPGKLKI